MPISPPPIPAIRESLPLSAIAHMSCITAGQLQSGESEVISSGSITVRSPSSRRSRGGDARASANSSVVGSLLLHGFEPLRPCSAEHGRALLAARPTFILLIPRVHSFQARTVTGLLRVPSTSIRRCAIRRMTMNFDLPDI
ncbi:hypothetical protein VTO73DRAFT_3512 [Trametes versicolor]